MSPQDDIERERAWVAGLGAGDHVALWDGWSYLLRKVLRVTPKRVLVDGSYFFRSGPRAGSRVGDRSRWTYIVLKEPTPEVRDEIEVRQLMHRMNGVKWSKQPLAVMRAIMALVVEEKAE